MHTLVLSSSSTNFAYQLGRLSCLDLSNVKHVVGTSAGAIIGTLLAFGWTPEAMLREALEYPWWDTVARNLNFTFFLFRSSWLCNSVWVRDKLLQLLPIQDTTTIGQVEKRTGIRLSFPVLNISSMKEEIFGSRETPEVPLLTALMATSAIPLVFPPVAYGSEWFCDGALTNTFPVNLAETEDALGIRVVRIFNSRERDLHTSFDWLRQVFFNLMLSNQSHAHKPAFPVHVIYHDESSAPTFDIAFMFTHGRDEFCEE